MPYVILWLKNTTELYKYYEKYLTFMLRCSDDTQYNLKCIGPKTTGFQHWAARAIGIMVIQDL